MKLAVLKNYVDEVTTIRKRMKSLDARIRCADAAIRQHLDEARAILHQLQAAH